MWTADRHDVTIGFPDLPDGSETPYVYRPFERQAWYEEAFLEHIRRRGRRGTYVDVGAHLGTHTAWFALLCPSTHVHAVEPVSRFADQLLRVVDANHLADKVTVHRTGVADRVGEGSNLLSPEHQIGFHPAGVPVAVAERFPVTTLDVLLPRRQEVAVVKLDVEGMEADVLRGASRTLSRHRPLVYAEAHDEDHLAGVAAVLAPFGYRPTGRVFNASPTYEFEAPARSRTDWVRPVWRLVPGRVKPLVRRVVRALGRPRSSVPSG